MPILNVEGVTHWSIPVNDLEEAEECYGELLGLAPVGRLGNNIMSCFNVGDHNILLCERPNPVDGPLKEDAGVHHSFTVSPRDLRAWVQGLPREKRRHRSFDVSSRGVFTGRELYFFDPSGNRLELRDATWTEGMPEPSFAELAGA